MKQGPEMDIQIRVPKGWNEHAQVLWEQGKKQDALNTALSSINSYGPAKPVDLVLQVAYYLFLCGDPASAAQFLSANFPYHQDNPEFLQNLAVCLNRSGQYEKAVEHCNRYLAIKKDSYLIYDILSSSLHQLGRDADASAAGTASLDMKDRMHGNPPDGWALPDCSPATFASSGSKKNIIAFSLWGNNPRYLRGAIDNAVSAAGVYPDWTLRFYADGSVPSEVCDALSSLGAEMKIEKPGQNLSRKLTWRFTVANDPQVGRFLIRDVDSVISFREKLAVEEWVASDRWFHVMRDWWTHTDLILAGMWGGVAGVLPPLVPMMQSYVPKAMETPNIDQWFLRDRIWSYVRTSCFIHDRCFMAFEHHPWPGPEPEADIHIGQNVFIKSRMKEQEARLGGWLDRLKCLSLGRG